MAEIGLVASVLSVAAFGTSVATTLYKTADVMTNARQQIHALAKHVAQFTAVLKHMGEVLDTEKANCSQELLRDVRKIKHSCKRTFREIKSAIRSKRFQHFVPMRWLFKRTKAMELEARLDSQQSMLQCIIHTLTVSKLGHIDSRSKQDSEHLTGLKMEIGLLKAFIMESHNTLTELRHAEQSTEVETQNALTNRGGDHPGSGFEDGDGRTLHSTSESIAYGLRRAPSPSPVSNRSRPELEDPNSDTGAHVDSDSSNSKDHHDANSAESTDDNGMTERSVPRLTFQGQSSYNISPAPDSTIHRESNVLLDMVLYKPSLPYRTHSDRLIHGVQMTGSDTKPIVEDAIDSVRLLLDKWTSSGSAPVSNILDEEASKDKREAEIANDHPASGFQSDPRRPVPPLPPGAVPIGDPFSPADLPGSFGNNPRFQDSRIPSSFPQDSRLPQYPYPRFQTPDMVWKDFWKPSHFLPPLDRKLGTDILSALRSNRGGIYYTKSNQFQQVHYVDQNPIYTCAFVPFEMVPDDERKALDTEIGTGLVRKETLDLLGYSYTATERGTFSISGDLDLRDIEEIVNLSYQAVDRDSRERSKTIIKTRGWYEVIAAINRVSGPYPNDLPMTPPRPTSYYYNDTPYNEYMRGRAYSRYEDYFPDVNAVRRAPSPRRAPNYTTIEPYERNTSAAAPFEATRQGQGRREKSGPEVRFTLPRAETMPITPRSDKEGQTHRGSLKPKAPLTQIAKELQSARQRLEQVKRRKETAEKAKDIATASDLTYFVIPELNGKIENLEQQQQQEDNKRQEKSVTSTLNNNDDIKSHHTEIETESEEDYVEEVDSEF